MTSPVAEFFFKRYADEVTQLRRFVAFSWFGLDRATDYAPIERTLYPFLERESGVASGTFQALIPGEDIQSFASEQKQLGFPFVYQVAVVRLWSILETVVDDAALYLLKHKPHAEMADTIRGIKAPIFEFLAADSESQRQFLLDCLKQEVRAALKIGIGRFECLLAAFGYSGSVPDPIRRNLLELSELRNLIVHKGGRADSRFVERCTWRGEQNGQAVSISAQDFARCAASADWYIHEILDRIRGEFESKGTASTADLHEALVKRKDHFATLLSQDQKAAPQSEHGE